MSMMVAIMIDLDIVINIVIRGRGGSWHHSREQLELAAALAGANRDLTVCTHVPALEGPPSKNKTSSKYRAEHVEGDGLAAGPELLDRLGAPVGVDLDLPPHMPARPPRHSCRQGRDGGD